VNLLPPDVFDGLKINGLKLMNNSLHEMIFGEKYE